MASQGDRSSKERCSWTGVSQGHRTDHNPTAHCKEFGVRRWALVLSSPMIRFVALVRTLLRASVYHLENQRTVADRQRDTRPPPAPTPASETTGGGRAPSREFKEKQKPGAQTVTKIYPLSRIPFNSSMKMSGSLHPGLCWPVPSISGAVLRWRDPALIHERRSWGHGSHEDVLHALSEHLALGLHSIRLGLPGDEWPTDPTPL